MNQSQPDNVESPPSMSPEAKENRLIALAYDLVEKRLKEGTASAQETVHFLKLGSSKSQIEIENLRAQNKLLSAKTDSLESEKSSDQRYKDVIKAMAIYRGEAQDEELYGDV